MSTFPATADMFLDEVAALLAAEPELSPLDAGVLVALGHGLASDTRTFARLFGVAHALVVRAASELEHRLGLIVVTDQTPRTQRRKMALSQIGTRLVRPRTETQAEQV